MKARGSSTIALVLGTIALLMARDALTQPTQPRPIPPRDIPPEATSISGQLTPTPGEHASNEVEFPTCPMTVHVGIGWEPVFIDIKDPTKVDAGRLFPEWWEVGRPHVIDHRKGSSSIDTTPAAEAAILEGTVESETTTPTSLNPSNTGAPQGERDHRGIDFTPHVTHDDMPISHFTHDINVHVRPDPTPDNRYTNIAGVQVHHDVNDPCSRYRDDIAKQEVRATMFGQQADAMGRIVKDLEMLKKPECKVTQLPDRKTRQPLIEIEWESGLAADNDGNPCAAANRRGDSCGFASAGHTRGAELWHWPTEGDHVHVEGEWIWDRGHPPADTEIHPPRFLSTQRKLPDVIQAPAGGNGTTPMVATRADFFANGDGTAFINNTKGPYASDYGVRHVTMSAKDYEVTITHPIERPTPTAAMRVVWEKHPGDTFPADPIVTMFPDGNTNPRDHRTPQATPHVVVKVPWKTAHAPDTAVFARTMHIYWDDAGSLGVAASGRPRAFQVTLDTLNVKKVTENGWRLFAEVGGHWMFLNELFPGDVLRDGLGKTGARSWPLHKTFTVYVPQGGRFRVYSGGWQAGGANRLFGKLMDPNLQCTDSLRDKLIDNLKKLVDGNGYDIPVGEMAFAVVPGAAKMKGYSETRAGVGTVDEDPIRGNVDPTGAYTISFHVDEVELPRVLPQGVLDKGDTRNRL